MFYVIAAALLPVLLLALYIYKIDDEQPEPKAWLWKAVLFGALSAVLDLIILSPLPKPTDLVPGSEGTALGGILTAFLSAGIPEEACKMFMLMLLIRKNPYFDDKMDGIVYASYIGLGFAGLENILYLVNNLDNFASVAISRAIFAIPGHFFFGVIMGYFVSLAYFASRTRVGRTRYLILAYLVPVLCHGIYDSILMIQGVSPQVSTVLTIVFLLFCNWLRKSGMRRINALRNA